MVDLVELLEALESINATSNAGGIHAYLQKYPDLAGLADNLQRELESAQSVIEVSKLISQEEEPFVTNTIPRYVRTHVKIDFAKLRTALERINITNNVAGVQAYMQAHPEFITLLSSFKKHLDIAQTRWMVLKPFKDPEYLLGSITPLVFPPGTYIINSYVCEGNNTQRRLLLSDSYINLNCKHDRPNSVDKVEDKVVLEPVPQPKTKRSNCCTIL